MKSIHLISTPSAFLRNPLPQVSAILSRPNRLEVLPPKIRRVVLRRRDASLQAGNATRRQKTARRTAGLIWVGAAQHTPSSSNDAAIANFVEAGRALGLNDDQLNDVLKAKGMLTATVSSVSYLSTPTSASVSHPSPDPASQAIERMPSTDKDKRRLFRSLSKGKKQKNDSAPTQALKSREPEARDVVVRRTLLIASEPNPSVEPTTHSDASPGIAYDSPNTSLSRQAGSKRKLSVKRKPINLTREDRELVSTSLLLHKRNASVGTTASGKSEGGPELASLGFLHPKAHLERSTSSAHSDQPSERGSTGGTSLYDLYNDDSHGELEVLQSPTIEGERRDSEQTDGSNKGVEVW